CSAAAGRVRLQEPDLVRIRRLLFPAVGSLPHGWQQGDMFLDDRAVGSVLADDLDALCRGILPASPLHLVGSGLPPGGREAEPSARIRLEPVSLGSVREALRSYAIRPPHLPAPAAGVIPTPRPLLAIAESSTALRDSL